MPAVSVNVRGLGAARRRVLQLRKGLNERRTRFDFKRRVTGAYNEAAARFTPRPENAPDSRIRRRRTGYLFSTYNGRFISGNVFRLRWGALYASYANRRGRYSRGYVQRTVREGTRRVRAYLADEQRKAAKRLRRRGG